MQVDLSGRTAIITGGSSGIGRAAALALARCGARVFVGDLSPREEHAESFAVLGIQQWTCDVRDPAQVRNLVERSVAETGSLNIVVSNAGINMAGMLPDVSVADWDACIDTNLKGAFLVCKYAIPHLQAAGGGAVVFTSSNAGLMPRAHDPVYGTSKAALIALAQGLALCHARDRIRFNAVCPGPVSGTGLIDDVVRASANPSAARREFIDASPLARAAGRMITPEEVAQALVYLASDAALMVTGTALRIDGGKSLGVPPA
jgi:NAD(P)-dependent dehydrogenase (short-subunit alcohol dehydrogenase family)